MNGIEINFPDRNNYDMSKIGELALYETHLDYYALKGLIDTTNDSVRKMLETYRMDIVLADDFGDMHTSSKVITSQTLYSARVIPMAYASILLMIISTLEEAFNRLCTSYCIKKQYPVQYKNLRGQGLDRAITYLDKVVGIKGIKQNPNWDFVKTARDARNIVVHNGGRTDDSDKLKFEKYDFNIREEDNQLMFDYEKILEIFNGVVQFTDSVFKTEPEQS